jgi:hypothetical protein
VIQTKLKKAWLKMLKAYSKGKWAKAVRLEEKILKLELELKRHGDN